MRLEVILNKIKGYDKKADFDLIRKAYNFAKKNHGDQKRASGELFIQHPLNVAYILAEHMMDTPTICAALLHDVVEDTDVTKGDIIKEFGQEIADIIDGVTKITKLREMSFEEYKAETVRKVILASTKDLRVVIIKLADKLHNMRTLSCFRQEKCERIAKEVMNIYAPIAYKLGMANIKWELEDLAFRYLEPEIYNDLQSKVKKNHKQREKDVEKIENILDVELTRNNISHIISGRSKHLYSIYKKMLKKDKPFSEIYDIVGLRIITQHVKDCYETMGIVHSLWTPIPKEFDDYIAMPKSNMYQSLHIVVIGPEGKPIEIQIRTEEMDRVAEDGVAAHWRYKGVEDKSFEDKLSWMKQILEWQKDSKDAKEFMELLNVDFFEDEIFTFTPKGRVVQLPKGATVLDFAYAVHSDIGDKTIAAKVNGNFVPLRTLIKNGDQVEVITSKNQHPSRDWLKIVRTSRAQSRIKKYIRSVQDIPVKTYKGEQDVIKELEEWIIEVDNVINPDITIAKCCNPLPGEDIVGFSTSAGKVTIHKIKCPRLDKIKLGPRRKQVKVHWINKITNSIVEIKVHALNRMGLFAEILNSLVAIQTPIKSASAKSLGTQEVECSFTIETSGIEHLQDIIRRMKKIKDVKNVFIGNLQR